MAVKPVLDWLSGAWRPAPSGRSPLSPPWRWPSSQGWIGYPALGGQSRQMFPERLPGTSQTSPLGLGESLAVGPGLDSLSGARRPAPSRRGKGISLALPFWLERKAGFCFLSRPPVRARRGALGEPSPA